MSDLMTLNPDNKSLDMIHHIVNVLKKLVCVKKNMAQSFWESLSFPRTDLLCNYTIDISLITDTYISLQFISSLEHP